MELRPADLGDSRAVDLFRMRATAQFASQRHGRLRAAFSSRGTPLDRFWSSATGLSEPAATAAIKSVGGQLRGMLIGFGGGWGIGFGAQAAVMASVGHQPIMAGVFGAMAAAGLALGALLPKAMVRRWGSTPLTDPEVEQLLHSEDDPLERDYLLLVREALRQKDLPEAAVAELREAIQVLGTALDRLPPAPAEATERDAGGLRTEAQQLRDLSRNETDRVAADSLERRADALERSAAAIEKSATLLRRNRLLRQELQAQLDALRLELTSSTVVSADGTGLAQVATVARGVAREADALASARRELDEPQQQPVGVSS